MQQKIHNLSTQRRRAGQRKMASQKLTNCCVAAIALAASTYVSTPHCSTIARLAFGAFCLAIDIDAFLRKHQRKAQKNL
jgi:hypothetical protein